VASRAVHARGWPGCVSHSPRACLADEARAEASGSRLGRAAPTRTIPVRAENVIHGSDQQGCPTSRPAVMITDDVPAVRVPPDHAGRSVAAAVPARGYVEDRGDPDPSPSAHRPATAAAMSPAAELGRPCLARGPARRDTQSAALGPAAAGYPETIVRWHRDIVRRRWALIVAEFGRCGGPMGVAERHTCLVLRLARACSEVWPVAADRVGIWLTGSGRSRGRCTRRLTRTGSAPTRCVTWRGHLGSPGRVAPRVTGSAVATSWP